MFNISVVCLREKMFRNHITDQVSARKQAGHAVKLKNLFNEAVVLFSKNVQKLIYKGF